MAIAVLPLPTSPCTRRCIGTIPSMLSSISRNTLFCPSVSAKGNFFITSCTKFPDGMHLIPTLSVSLRFRKSWIPACMKNNSSKAVLLRAACCSSQPAGSCIPRIAAIRPIKCSRTRTSAGRFSLIPSAWSMAKRIIARICKARIPSVRG